MSNEHRAFDYDQQRDIVRTVSRESRDVVCESCGTIDHATPRRKRCRFCGSPVHEWHGDSP